MVTDIILMCCDIALGVFCLLYANHNAVKGNKGLAMWEYCIGALDFFVAGAMFSRIIAA